MFRQTPPITKNLIIINVLMFFAQLAFERHGIRLEDWLGLHFVLADNFGVWQFVTYLFMHGGFSHIFFNMFSLWMFGRIIEQVLGPRRFLLYYFVCGIGAGVCQELWQTAEYFIEGMQNYQMVDAGGYLIPMSQYLNMWTTIGASGACYGVLLAYGMTFPNERILLLIPPIPMKAKYFVAGYAVIEVLSAFSVNSNIAHLAHLGGMLFGLLLLLHWRHKARRGSSFTGWKTYAPRTPWYRRLADRLGNALRGRQKAKGAGGGFKDRADDYDFNARRKEREEHVDKILDKIRRSGYDSLTEDEKNELFRNSRR